MRGGRLRRHKRRGGLRCRLRRCLRRPHTSVWVRGVDKRRTGRSRSCRSLLQVLLLQFCNQLRFLAAILREHGVDGWELGRRVLGPNLDDPRAVARMSRSLLRCSRPSPRGCSLPRSSSWKCGRGRGSPPWPRRLRTEGIRCCRRSGREEAWCRCRWLRARSRSSLPAAGDRWRPRHSRRRGRRHLVEGVRACRRRRLKKRRGALLRWLRRGARPCRTIAAAARSRLRCSAAIAGGDA